MAATDVLSSGTAKNALKMSPSDVNDDRRLALAIAAVSSYLDQNCGAVVQRGVVDELFPSSAGYLGLSTQPVASIASVVSYVGGVGTTLTAETATVAGDYRVFPFKGSPGGLLSGRLARRAAFADSTWNPASRVVATYTAGRYASTSVAEVTKFGAAAVVLLRWFFHVYDDNIAQAGEFDVPFVSFPSGDAPPAARELLGNDWLTGGSSRLSPARLGSWRVPGAGVPSR